MIVAPNDTCSCGAHPTYAECCGLYHLNDDVYPPTAQALMRSRYSAFVHCLDDYLLQTWHHSTRPHHLTLTDRSIQWLGLRIKQCATQDAEHATVEFVARSKRHGRASRLHETSRFLRENDRWYYVDGDIHQQ